MAEWGPITLNFMYAGLGGVLGIALAWAGARLFANVMGFRLADELKAGNVAVGLALMGIYLGMGIGMGLVIAFALN